MSSENTRLALARGSSPRRFFPRPVCALVFALGVLAAAPVATAQQGGPSAEELWKQYPLYHRAGEGGGAFQPPTETEPAPQPPAPPRASPEPTTAPQPSAEDTGGSDLSPALRMTLFVVLGVGLVVTVAALAALSKTFRRGSSRTETS